MCKVGVCWIIDSLHSATSHGSVPVAHGKEIEQLDAGGGHLGHSGHDHGGDIDDGVFILDESCGKGATDGADSGRVEGVGGGLDRRFSEEPGSRGLPGLLGELVW